MNPYDLERQAKLHLKQLRLEAELRLGDRPMRPGRTIARWLHTLADRFDPHPPTVQRTVWPTR